MNKEEFALAWLNLALSSMLDGQNQHTIYDAFLHTLHDNGITPDQLKDWSLEFLKSQEEVI